MRILFILYGSLEQVSGGYLYDRRVIAWLRGRGLQVDLFELDDRPGRRGPLCSFHGGLRRAFRGEGYDCLVIDELTHPAVFLAAARRPPGGPRLVTLVHHLKCREPISRARRAVARAMERVLLDHSDALVVNSRATEGSVRELLRREVPIFLCPPGADTFEGPRAGARGRAGPVRLLATGNLIPRKGLHLLIPMLAAVRELDWELRVVGGWADAGYKRRLDRLVRKAGLEGRVRFTGRLPESELAREYGEADVFVFPSRYEGFGISLAEAVRSGLPFAAFAAGGTAEAVGDPALLAPDGDLERFAERLRGLIADPERRAEAGRRSSELAGRLPRWEDTGRAFLAALREVTGRD